MKLALTVSQLPLSLEEITAEWLTVALVTRFPGVAVHSMIRDAERAGTSTSARFSLRYEATGGHDALPEAVYVKGGFDPVMRKRVWAALIQESRFYAELAEDVPIDVPTAYFAGVDHEGAQGVVVLEDLTHRGARFGHATRPLASGDVAKVIEQLARMHARFWNDRRLPSYREWAEPQRTYLRYLFRPKHWDAVCERSYGDLLRRVLPSPARALEWLATMWDCNAAHVPTLLHGDCHAGNLFYTDSGRPGFLDWQCAFPGAPGHDLAELLLSILTTEARREQEADLIAYYHATLAQHGVQDIPTRESLFLSYRQNIMHMLASAVMNPFDMQSEEVTEVTAVRALHAALDLDVVGALTCST